MSRIFKTLLPNTGIVIAVLWAMIAMALPSSSSYAECSGHPDTPCALVCDTKAEALDAAAACCSTNPPYTGLCGCHYEAHTEGYNPPHTIAGAVPVYGYRILTYGPNDSVCGDELHKIGFTAIAFLKICADPTDPCCGRDDDPCCGKEKENPCCLDPTCGQCPVN